MVHASEEHVPKNTKYIEGDLPTSLYPPKKLQVPMCHILHFRLPLANEREGDRGRRYGPSGQQIRPDSPTTNQPETPEAATQQDRRKNTLEENTHRAKAHHPTQHTRDEYTQAPDSAHHPILSAGSQPNLSLQGVFDPNKTRRTRPGEVNIKPNE